jgi:hypothetical protein
MTTKNRMRWMVISTLALATVAQADTISDATSWLRDKLHAHGLLVNIFADVRQDSHYDLTVNSCNLVLTETITSFVRSGNKISEGTSSIVYTVPMGKLNPKKIASHPDGSNGAYYCSVMEAEDKVVLVHSQESADSYRVKAQFCYDQQDLAERSLKALADIASACGAKVPNEKY